ncbi:MAG: hypothetical protein AM326_06920 [Candidatus Thorarchaeota archaeon SMTZ-45]|nr:MAG: hypothetical protein AM325_03415 [Candidatus Thorarchaeota archaeon SMTZ1-45]KXH76535.1 MAG: hypothetical protein AM326_06920 [Candidatus Thorarchaeota archaeon SMTZ-45]
MKRDDPLLLPLCQICGEYKGVGPCKNPACPDCFSRDTALRKEDVEQNTHQTCGICGKVKFVSCAQCGNSFCESHSLGANSNHFMNFNQHLGTCVECLKIICENCWILSPKGEIICLVHLEKERKTHAYRSPNP